MHVTGQESKRSRADRRHFRRSGQLLLLAALVLVGCWAQGIGPGPIPGSGPAGAPVAAPARAAPERARLSSLPVGVAAESASRPVSERPRADATDGRGALRTSHAGGRRVRPVCAPALLPSRVARGVPERGPPHLQLAT